MQELHK